MVDISYEEHRSLIERTARRVQRRLYAAGARTVQFEDIAQELTVAFCIAAERWKPEHNVPFKAYLMRGMYNHVNRWVQSEIDARLNAEIDLDAEIGEDGGASLHELVADDNVLSPDEALIAKDIHEQIMARLHGRARQFISILANPPEEVMAQVTALRDRSQYARSRGINEGGARSDVASTMVLDLMGCSAQERRSIRDQVSLAISEVSQA